MAVPEGVSLVGRGDRVQDLRMDRGGVVGGESSPGGHWAEIRPHVGPVGEPCVRHHRAVSLLPSRLAGCAGKRKRGVVSAVIDTTVVGAQPLGYSSDERLISRLRANDDHAFAQLVARY